MQALRYQGHELFDKVDKKGVERYREDSRVALHAYRRCQEADDGQQGQVGCGTADEECRLPQAKDGRVHRLTE